ncbi:MAG TPA: tagaturonate reductase [Firmicutes bacterium]|nr:tagaturonate reductase [Bacillota bacterium]
MNDQSRYPLLNRRLLGSGFQFPADLVVPPTGGDLPERVVQFGEGNFLRAFVDWMFQQLIVRGLFDGKVVIVQPLPQGMVEELNRQEGLYTLLLRGYKNEEAISHREIIASVSRGLNAYTNWRDVLRLAENPALRFVVSNTTEAGIAYDPRDSRDFEPPVSFPGKLALFLYRRYRFFSGDPGKGLVIIPCELIEQNGAVLKEIILRLAREWRLDPGFSAWLEQANIFVSTLVDRVVTGYPAAEIPSLTAELGYEDRLITAAESYHLWVIEGPPLILQSLPFTEAGLRVIVTDDLAPYRTRKVRILNGAHTTAVPVAFLYGLDTVRQMVEDPLCGRFAREAVFEEIIPSLDDPAGQSLAAYGEEVFARFCNPLIRHNLKDILLNSTAKFKTRVLPSLLAYREKKGCIPERITFSFAALLTLYRRDWPEQRCSFQIKDDPAVLSFLAEAWQKWDGSPASAAAVTGMVLNSKELWGGNLQPVQGLQDKVADWLWSINSQGLPAALHQLLEGGGGGLSRR